MKQITNKDIINGLENLPSDLDKPIVNNIDGKKPDGLAKCHQSVDKYIMQGLDEIANGNSQINNN